MTCQECTGLLFEDGSLLDEPGGELHHDALVHLNECEDCRGLARELKENAAALREMRDDELPQPIHVSTVGSAPRPNVVAMPVSKKIPVWWFAAAAALILGAGLGALRMNRGAQLVEQAAQQSPGSNTRPAVEEVLPSIPQTFAGTARLRSAEQALVQEKRQQLTSRAQRERTGRLNVAAQSTASGEPMPYKIKTADPNVVIYWLAGDSHPQEVSEGEIL